MAAEQKMEVDGVNKEECEDEMSEEMSDYVDFGLVEIWDDESKTIFEILKVKNTSLDKLTYTVFSLNIFLTCFLIGYVPNYFYLWHTVKAVILISYRWYSYKKQRYHYFLLDLCYFTNLLTLLYVWLPESLLGPSLRGRLFTTCYAFAYGPVLCAIMLWKNSLVPHSTDKMTSLFIHVSPALSLAGLRWFSSPDQGFPICSTGRGFDRLGCLDADISEILYYPLLMYIAWQLFYILVVDIINREKIDKNNYSTSYKYLMVKSKNSAIARMVSAFGARYRKVVYFAAQFLYTLLSVHLAYLCYISLHFNIFAILVMMGVASYNGASFYIDVFSVKYASDLKSKSN